MNRRSIIILLIGVIAALAGSLAAAFLKQNRCASNGGQWQADTQLCRLPTGETVSTAAMTDALVGIFVAVVLGFMLFRIFLFASGRMSRPTP